MNEKTKITLVLGGIVLLVIGAVSVSFAFLSVAKKQDIANNFTSGCLNISIENESNAITLNNTYPITDLEGLVMEGYTFTIKNTCTTSSNYQINLESLNQTVNTLDTQYIKTSLSSDTMDNLIQKLDSNLVTKAYIENAYVSHNLYKGTIDGNSTKEFNLKLWIDYDTTKEQGANKTYTSKINVIANPDIEVTTEPEIKTLLVNDTLEGTITGNANTAKYCVSNDNKCVPNTNATITDNKINVELDRSNDRIVCVSLNEGKTLCSNRIEKVVPITIPDIVATLNPKDTTPTFSKIATTDEGVYKVEDGMYGGTSYYWRGAVTNNYVTFAGKCWRIVRINGDGSMRLIYDGATCHANGTNTADNIAVTSQAYNTNFNQSYYVGWTYSIAQRPSIANPQTGGTATNAKTQLESWYNSNIGNNTTFSSKVADGKYCNDRDVGQPLSSWSGFVTTWSTNGTKFAYAGAKRLWEDYAPTLSCSNGDIYSLKVGLITADEVEFAGGKNEKNTSYYLYNGQNYWTMSPRSWEGYAYVFVVDTSGRLDAYSVFSINGLRPVINLKSDTLFAVGGNGTQNNPYVVQ